MNDVVRVSTGDRFESLRAAVSGARCVLVADPRLELSDEIVERLAAGASAPGVASASPVPVDRVTGPMTYPTSPAAPPDASVAVPCLDVCVLNTSAIASLGPDLVAPRETVRAGVMTLSERMLQHGWRHVVAAGVAMTWNPTRIGAKAGTAGWTAASLASLSGPANAGLEAHISWASARTRGIELVVDGACMTSQPYTGTQHLVLEISRWLSASRPDAHVRLAIPVSAKVDVRAALRGFDVEVVERRRGLAADVVYRPYQMLLAAELEFVLGTGRRALVGQLDMIGFSNPCYHPSDQLFFFARNIQRHLLRSADGVTFISRFGHQSAFAECPDLDPDRMHVVYCGADPRPLRGTVRSDRGVESGSPLIACMASTFWHKNRTHAIATFAMLAQHHGYPGRLVIAGPEPYYGRSLDEEDAILADLPPDVSARVERWGHIDEEEKWWLLENAQVVLYPSIVEGFGLVPFEAAAVGTPCLVNDNTAPGELLGDTPAAIASWDPVVWAEHVARLVEQPTEADRVAQAIRDVAASLTWERCAQRTWAAIDHALAAPRRSLHHEDGGNLARVSGSFIGHGASTGLKSRFHAARAVPGLRRRLGRLAKRPWSPMREGEE